MITAGIDVGAKGVKAVIIHQDRVLAREISSIGFDEKKAVAITYQRALDMAGLSNESIAKILTTGMGSRLVDFADAKISINQANARGVAFLFPSAHTLIDVGAEESRAITCNDGYVTAFAVNDRCAG